MVKEIYIAGEWRLGRGEKIQSLFPADQSVNAEISTASLDDVNEAVEKADLAWRQSSWRNSMPHERARILYKVADIIGKTAFLAPLIFTSPLRVLPPLIIILAIFTFPPDRKSVL